MTAAVSLPSSLGVLLEERASTHAEHTALNFVEQALTVSYAELNDYVNRVANVLHDLGVRRRTHVAVMSANSLDYCACWLALAKLGAVLISVNARYTPRELDYVLTDGDSSLLLCDTQGLTVAEQLDAPPQAVCFTPTSGDPEGDWSERVAAAPVEFAIDTSVGLDDLLNIQYTSGTTGFPKGCMLSHRFWLHSARLMVDDLDFPVRRTIYNQNFFYMDGPFLAAVMMLAGGTLFMVTRPSASNFLTWSREHRIEYCFFFEALYKQPEQGNDADNSYRLMHTFGLSRDSHADVERRYATLAREAYGMTECGAALRVPMSVTDMVGSGSCGLPLPTRELAIVDDQGKQVASGEVGELWIKGPGLMLGYYNKPEATADVFRGEWLRTGDLFRQDERGYYYIVGRKKDMVRRNAENIACREVEEVLRSMPAIREAAVVPVPDERVGEEVKAYLQLREGFDVDDVNPERVLEFCRERLAVFKVPRYIEYRDSFPMTDSARVEKQKVVAESEDLRLHSYDAVEQRWH